MLLLETAIFYLLLGITVAAAVYLRGETGNDSGYQLVAACLFWPLFVPTLLSSSEKDAESQAPPALPDDSQRRCALGCNLASGSGA